MIAEARHTIETTLTAAGIRVLAPSIAPTIDDPCAQVTTSSIKSHDTGCGWLVTTTVYLTVPTKEPGVSDDDLDTLADTALAALDRISVGINALRGTYNNTNPAYIVSVEMLTT